VVVQLFGFTGEVTVYLFLKTSMAPSHQVLAREVVTLNAQNNHQAEAKVRVRKDLDKSADHVILHVQSDVINQHQSVPISRTNGFLFIQTDKPLYTPRQSVKVRAFSLNQELRPANRSVYLTFKVMDIVEMVDVNNGIPSLQNPFKIPVNPKLGIWSIEASYSKDFTTTATTDFEVREYVLPSFSIQVEPEANYISHNSFTSFNFKVSARYLHGAPVVDGDVFLRYGYVSGKSPPLSSAGDVDVNVNMQKVLSEYNGPKDLNSLLGKYLYIAVLVEESTGGITQETEFAAVKFVKSPYSLSLVSTPPFLKPGLPYNIQVCVLVANVSPCCCWQFQTDDSTLPAASQSSLTLTAVAYYSPNQRYLYIDAPLMGPGLQVGRPARLSVYSATPSYIPITTISYLVISKGKVVDFGSQKFLSNAANKQSLSFQVTPAMVPSIRLLVYYILFGEGTFELVADSVWLAVEDRCISGLQVQHHTTQYYKPKEQLQLDVRANQDGLVALSAVDAAIFTLRPNYRDPVSMVLRHIEQSDLGCGGGGGKDSADVFRLAGLTFITNANTAPSTSSTVYYDVRAGVSQCVLHSCLCTEMGADFGLAPSLVRSYFPESWMWEVHSGRLAVSRTLPDSITTWQIKAVGMFKNGMCVADPVQVSVSLPLSVDIPLPYQVVRGEQLELKGSVYNQLQPER
uniref:Complement C5-like n=1 Tax=Neolamprologus brichardi TaxID=32507 RepID=A0A3Q4I626_NEOBR